jgi:hypothetical protein
MCAPDRIVKVFVAVLGIVACTASAVLGQSPNDCSPGRGGGNVLPPFANPHGYSLSDAAEATAVYNAGQAAGITEPPPNVPFEVLVDDTTVKLGTTLYLPIFFADDSGTVAPGFPKHVQNQDACADFLDSYVLMNFGVTDFIVQVDGETTILEDDYIVGVRTAPLPDGPPAGTHYIVSAAFISPLAPGKHTVALGGIISGAPVVFVSYEVDVTVR